MAASLFKWLTVYTMFFAYKDAPAPGDRATGSGHPMYVTVTEINHNAKDRTLEISCKIFTNDFEDALLNTFHTKVDLSQPKDKKAADKLVNDYIVKHLQISVDGKLLTLQFVGSEKETDATWSYFQVSDLTTVKKMEISNTLLYESFANEINIMHVAVSGNRKSTKLTNPDSHAIVEF